MPRGGARIPGPGKSLGPRKKPKSELAVQIWISLPAALYRQVKAHGKHSKLIQRLLTEYFKEINDER